MTFTILAKRKWDRAVLLSTEVIPRIIEAVLYEKSSRSNFFSWAISVFEKFKITGDAPWCSYAAQEWFRQNVNPGMKIFEWGSGTSTIFFAKAGAAITSVEHDATWAKEVLQASLHFGTAINLLFVPRESELSAGPGEYAWPLTEKQKRHISEYASYVGAIDSYPDESFDLILVDGRSRIGCAMHAVKKIKKGGYLVVDNAERERYQTIGAMLDSWNRKDLFGLIPGTFGTDKTSVWRRPSL